MSNEMQFLRELASVRPGLPSKALREIVGARWREPLPHEQGKVLCIDHSHAFSAQIDTDGIVGRVQFGRLWSDPAFSSEVDVSGLRRGMSIEDARKARADLTIRPCKHPAPTSGIAMLDDHTRLRLQFLFDELRVIEFVDDRAVYPEKRATPYPAPVDPPGAPFKDPNFKLVVMSELLDRHMIDLGLRRELAEFVLKRPFDVEREGHALLHPVYEYPVRYPLSKMHLDAVETIVFDGGNSIYPYIWPFWGGESDDFDVQHIEGIELCQNVREVHAISMLNETDFSRLAQLPKLKTRRGVP
jgi:hypothetical protein